MKKTTKLLSTTFLAAALLFSLNGKADASFTDVKEGFWAHDEINWAKDQGLIVGYDDGNFRPSKTLTEAQFVAMLTRYSGEDIAFSDDHWADFYYEFLEDHKFPVVSGSHPSQRNKPIRRGDIATVLAAYKGLDLKEKEAIQNLLDKEISTGRAGATVQGFDANSYLNRAHAVTFLYRMNEQGYDEFIGLAKNDDSSNDTPVVEPIPDEYVTYIEGNPFSVRTLDQLDSTLKDPTNALGYQTLKRNHAENHYGLQIYKEDGTSTLNATYHNGGIRFQINGERLNVGREVLITAVKGFFPDVNEKELRKLIDEVHKQPANAAQLDTLLQTHYEVGDYSITYINSHGLNRSTLTFSK